MPHADAYVDIQLRGEGEKHLYGDREFLRFFVSGCSINNCIGALCLSYFASGPSIVSRPPVNRTREGIAEHVNAAPGSARSLIGRKRTA